MDRRAFNKLLLATGAVGLAEIPWGISGADAQGRGGVLNSIIQPEPPMLILGINQQGPTQTVAGKIYQSLLTYGFDLSPQPGLAERWEMSSDGRTYTFHLAHGVTWHDGKPFTADDVVFSTQTLLMETHPRARAIFSRCESITAADPHTVVFVLKEPFGPFIQAFELSTTPIMPKHIYDGTDYRNNPANQTPIGTGPFKFKEWVRGSYIHLVRNESYFKKDKPALDEIYYRVIPDAASRALALETGTVQLTQFGDIETFDVPRMRAMPNLAFTTKGYEFFAPIAWLEINNRIAPMNDKRFRQALLYAIDRNFIRDKIWFGLGRVPTGPINSVTKFYDGDVKRYDFAAAKAIALLDEMGLMPDADGVRARLKLLNIPYGEVWTRMGEYIRQSLSKVGIAITLENTDAGGWNQRVSNWDFELTVNYVYQYGDPALGVGRTYISSNIRKGVMFSNTAGYTNPEVDKLFDDAAAIADDALRQQLYSKAQKILADEVPIAWLLEVEFPTFHDKRFDGLVTSAIGVNETFDAARTV